MKKKQSARAKKASLKNLNTNEDRQRFFWVLVGGLTAIIGGIIGAGISNLF
jgi:ABC-type branched-subunit amino acid transport system permease subunit